MFVGFISLLIVTTSSTTYQCHDTAYVVDIDDGYPILTINGLPQYLISHPISVVQYLYCNESYVLLETHSTTLELWSCDGYRFLPIDIPCVVDMQCDYGQYMSITGCRHVTQCTVGIWERETAISDRVCISGSAAVDVGRAIDMETEYVRVSDEQSKETCSSSIIALTNPLEREYQGCLDLIDLTLSNLVDEVGAFAFQGCKSLVRVKFSLRLISIGQFAFSDTNLTTIEMPSLQSTIIVGPDAFDMNVIEMFNVIFAYISDPIDSTTVILTSSVLNGSILFSHDAIIANSTLIDSATTTETTIMTDTIILSSSLSSSIISLIGCNITESLVIALYMTLVNVTGVINTSTSVSDLVVHTSSISLSGNFGSVIIHDAQYISSGFVLPSTDIQQLRFVDVTEIYRDGLNGATIGRLEFDQNIKVYDEFWLSASIGYWIQSNCSNIGRAINFSNYTLVDSTDLSCTKCSNTLQYVASNNQCRECDGYCHNNMYYKKFCTGSVNIICEPCPNGQSVTYSPSFQRSPTCFDDCKDCDNGEVTYIWFISLPLYCVLVCMGIGIHYYYQ